MDFLGDSNIATFITMALTVITMVAGGLWMSAKGKIKDIVDLGNTLVDAIEDNAITPEEVNGIKTAFKKVIGKD